MPHSESTFCRLLSSTTLLLFLLPTLLLGQETPSETLTVGGKDIRDYRPVLAKTLERALPLDPQTGLWVEEVKDDLWVVTDGIWQSAFLTTGKGVVVFDAPASYGEKLIATIGSKTKEPITHLVYSHGHKDHIAGAAQFKSLPNLEILAHQEVDRYLRELKDPSRPVPTRTFGESFTLRIGDQEVELSAKGPYHSSEADIVIFFPRQKVLYAIDSVTPGWVTFQNLDLTANVHEYLKIGEVLLAYDFDLFVGGHLTQLGNRREVELAVQYTDELLEAGRRAFTGTGMVETMAKAASQVGWDNKFLLFRFYQETMVAACAEEMTTRWADKLSGLDVWIDGHCDKVITYLRVD